MIIAQHSYYTWNEPFIRLNRLSVVSFHRRLPVCASCITGVKQKRWESVVKRG